MIITPTNQPTFAVHRSPTALRKSTDNNGTHRNGGQYATQVSPHHQLPTLSSAMLTPPQMATRSRSPTPQRRVGFVSADGDQQKAVSVHALRYCSINWTTYMLYIVFERVGWKNTKYIYTYNFHE